MQSAHCHVRGGAAVTSPSTVRPWSTGQNTGHTNCGVYALKSKDLSTFIEMGRKHTHTKTERKCPPKLQPEFLIPSDDVLGGGAFERCLGDGGTTPTNGLEPS